MKLKNSVIDSAMVEGLFNVGVSQVAFLDCWCMLRKPRRDEKYDGAEAFIRRGFADGVFRLLVNAAKTPPGRKAVCCANPAGMERQFFV